MESRPKIESPSEQDGQLAGMLAQFDSPEAWRMVGVAFVAMFTVYGIAYSFGAFFKPMAADFGADRSRTSAVFSLTVCAWSMLGSLSGHLSDRLGPRVIVASGALVMGVGLVATAFIERLWMGYLTYSLAVGVGVAAAYVPTVAVVGGWFFRRRNAALGIAVSGIGCGTLLVAPLAARLIESFGWRDTYIVFGVASTAILLVCAAALKRPPVHVTPSALKVRDAIRTPAFGLLYGSQLMCSMALFVPFVYLPAFAHDHGASGVASAALVGVIGGASVLGRLGLGALADRAGLIRLYQGAFLLMATSYALWLGGTSYPTLVIFALAMGTGYGGYVALSPAVLTDLYGPQRLGTVMGILYTSGAVGAMLGPPLAGAIIDYSHSYRWAIAYALAAAVASFVTLLPLERFASPQAPT
jgi:MFS family permease